jgi:S-adenosylmethionine hydrolase
MTARAIVTLLTDFGHRDPFVGIMKGVILSRCPGAQIVDLTHEVPPYDIRGASFVWRSALRFFPEGSVHVAVVDPGVGGPRRALLAEVEGRLCLAPDNGLLTCPLLAGRSSRVFALTAEQYWLHPVSASFQGRDVFAPVAGALAAGTAPEEVGAAIADPVRFEVARPRRDAEGVAGQILWVDRFGNCLTNLDGTDLEGWEREPMEIEVKGRQFGLVVSHFAAVPEGTAAGVVGSMGVLELVVNRGNCAAAWNLAVGDRVLVRQRHGVAVLPDPDRI